MIDYSKKVKIEDQKLYVIDKHGYVYKIKKYKYNPETKHTDDSRICVGKILITKTKSSIQTMIDRAGLFVVVSNTKMSPKEMIVITRNRDKVEKSFKRIKSNNFFSLNYA